MEKVIEVLNRMQADGVFEKFAIGGGIAAIYYLEPYQTDDIDVFFLPVFFGDSGLVSQNGFTHIWRNWVTIPSRKASVF